MAGGFDPKMAVKKNKFMEEWNGKREITEKSFSVGFGDAPVFFIYAILVPYGVYTWSRSELLSRGNPKYRDIA